MAVMRKEYDARRGSIGLCCVGEEAEVNGICMSGLIHSDVACGGGMH